MKITNFVKTLLNSCPEIALFLAIAIGYAIGKIRFGSFQLGGVAGGIEEPLFDALGW
jgi:uncharacterized transporter YbjL